MTFWCDVKCSFGFRKILEGSEVSFDILGVLRRSSILSCVLSNCERFMYILRYPLTFSGLYKKF